MVEASGIEPPASATGNLLRNAVLARKSPEKLGVEVPDLLLSIPSHTTPQRTVETQGRHIDPANRAAARQPVGSQRRVRRLGLTEHDVSRCTTVRYFHRARSQDAALPNKAEILARAQIPGGAGD